MNADPLRLDALLESVADGSAVDWEAAAEAAADERQRRIVRNLRLVASIADVHRTVPEEPPSTPPSLLRTVEAGQAIPRWGHLLLLETIGEGTFGEVYRARDPWLDREVALKLLKPGISSPGRLIAEAQALARVRHANVVTVHGADLHDGRVGLWMELVRGRTLASIVATDGPFSAAEAIVIGQELCRAVSAVHSVGLVHRDIKAQNVMRESGGRLVLMDFGAGHTPLYLAPEVAGGGEACIASDIYALGVLLYYLVTGKYPVVGASINELRSAHARGDRRQLADARPDLPDAFVAVVERAIRSDPAQRFATSREMHDALGTVVGSGSQDSSRATWLRMPRWRIPAFAAAVLIALGAFAIYESSRSEPEVAHAAVHQVAVLPLKPVSGTDPYMAAGLTEALTQELSMAAAVPVVSRTSVDRLVADHTPLAKLAEALNADTLIEGSVSRNVDDISVNIRVIRADTGSAVWARTFERAASNLPLIEREIARAVADEFRLAVASNALSRWQSPQQLNPASYDEYMRGRYEYRRGSQSGVEGAVTHFEKAIATEPRYARAHASLANSYVALGALRVLAPAEAARRARESAMRALQIDEALPEAHTALAGVEFDNWNFAEAEKQYLRAIELDPSFVEPRTSYALFLASRGRFDEAFAQLTTARGVDPMSSDVADRAAATYYYARRYPEALAEAQRAIRLDPDNIATQLGLARILNAAGKYDEAFAQAERVSGRASNHPWFQAEMAQADLGAGRIASGRRRIGTLITRSGEPVPRAAAYTLAVAFARVDRNEAFRWLEREFDTRGAVLWVKVDPRLDPLHADRRWPGLLKRLQLEP